MTQQNREKSKPTTGETEIRVIVSRMSNYENHSYHIVYFYNENVIECERQVAVVASNPFLVDDLHLRRVERTGFAKFRLQPTLFQHAAYMVHPYYRLHGGGLTE